MEYIPGAPVNDEVKKANQNLPGMGGVFNVVNFHLYHYAGNNPVKYVDPDGRITDDDIAAGEAVLQNGATKNQMSDLANTKNLAQIIVENRSKLDWKTRMYIRGLGKNDAQRAAAVENILNNVTVYSNVGQQKMDAVIGQHAPGMPGNLEGLTIGNNIYFAHSVSPMNQAIANLLGHEAIHSLQAVAYGGVGSFMNAYLSDIAANGYSQKNKFELAAYKFGGDSKGANINLSKSQVLLNYKGWWK